MSCFWDAIIRKLNSSEWSLLGLSGRVSPSVLCQQCKKKNRLVGDGILWQGKVISRQERSEHFEMIKDYGCHTWSGHLTSSCDSFLLLLTDICCINIEHRGSYGVSNYTNPKAKRKIILHSNRGHMW